MEDLAKDLKALGSAGTKYEYDKPDPKLLETFPSPFHNEKAKEPTLENPKPEPPVRLNPNGVKPTINIRCPEFTSLCPKTGQPDFACIVIEYVPDRLCVESKSLKLYLGSFRMHGEFHEACVNRIANDLVTLLKPRYLKVVGEFTPRGGIPFWPTAEYHV